jgi:carbamoyltransferase
LICGLKLTHDGALAVIDGQKLLFSIELEKVANRPRHSPLDDARVLVDLLRQQGIALKDVKRFVVDGWARFPDNVPRVDFQTMAGEKLELEVAGYTELSDARVAGDPLRSISGVLPLGETPVPFRSYLHATNHATGAYATSPLAVDKRNCLILVWDGGMPACLYSFDAESRSLKGHGVVLDIVGSLYPVFASCFPPFYPRPRGTSAKLDWRLGHVVHSVRTAGFLPVSGKAMAYAGLGSSSGEAMAIMDTLASEMMPINGRRCFLWSRKVIRALQPLGLSDASIIATFSDFLFARLLRGLKEKLAAIPEPMPFIFVGGCALNIKWNSALRASGLFEDIWVPPFPNDAGSALGAACSEAMTESGCLAIEWDVFSGPELGMNQPPPKGWHCKPFSIEELARLLHEAGEPVVLLSGRAELGPRALGHRSIIAPATSVDMQDRLNAMKKREPYRPVAPVCLESRAQEIFRPGTPDPYMLFDHEVRNHWLDRVPAIVHADRTARLQTVGPDNTPLYELLTAYDRLSGIPVLCNTSANLSERGFFPDAASAMEWGEASYVWADGTLYWADGAKTVA